MTEATTEQDVVDVLTTDHREAQDLVQQIRTTSEAEQRRQMADSLISELVRHSVAEEMFVYPAMTKHLPNGKESVEHDTQEHKQLERIMKDLEGVQPTDAQFDQLVTQLEQVLDDHVKDEEDDQFPQLREHIPHEDLVKMAQRVQAAKKIAPTRPHPDAPNNVLFHMMVGPGVGLVDRLRDRLSQHKVD